MRFPGGRSKALTLSYDDGVEQDIHLVALMRQYGVKGTFNLNSGQYRQENQPWPAGTIHRRMTAQATFNLFHDSGMEVAVHGLQHPFLERLPAPQALYEVLTDRINLEQQFGTIIRGMAYPYGTYSDEVVEELRCAGIAYARTVEETLGFGLPNDWLRLASTCHHTHPDLRTLTEQFMNGQVKAEEDGWLFYLWGHSYEFEADDNWDVIQWFLERTGGCDAVWYATNIEIYDYIQAFHRLVFSLDGRRVRNPSSCSVWFAEDDGTLICVKAGETKVL